MARVILIDDVTADRRLAETLLEHAGHSVMQSDDGQNGLEMIMTAVPDLVITDLITPSIDGYALARSVRSNPKTASIPIMMVTAHYLEAEVRRLAAGIGIQQVLIKPYEPQAFLEAVAAALSEKPTADQVRNADPNGQFQIE